MTAPSSPILTPLSLPSAMPSAVMLSTSIVGSSSPDEYCVRPLAPPAVPKSSAIELSAAPVDQLLTEIVGGLGDALAKVPSLLKVTVIGLPEMVPLFVPELASVGSAKSAVQVLSAVLVQVIVTLLA